MAEETENKVTVTQRIMEPIASIYTDFSGRENALMGHEDTKIEVEPWNRTTIADGLWLQENAIAPFSARDIMLANEIDSTNERVSALEEAATDGREVRSFSPRVWSGDDTSWHNIHNTRVIPDDELIPKNSVMYMPMVYSSPTHGETSEGGVLSMNSKNKSFQLEINETGVYWDFGDPNNPTSNVNGDYGSFKVDTQTGKHGMKILTEADKKDLGDKFWLLTSAGYQKFGLDENELKWDADRNLTLKHYPSEWLVTDEHEVKSNPGTTESVMHGSSFDILSASNSLLVANRVTASAEGSFIRNSYICGSTVDTSGGIANSIILGAGTQIQNDPIYIYDVPGGNPTVDYCLIMNNCYDIRKLSNTILGGQGSNIAQSADSCIAWGNGSLRNATSVLQMGNSNSHSSGCSHSIHMNNGGYEYDSRAIIAFLEGSSAFSANRSLMMIGGGTVTDANRSIIMNGNGRQFKDIQNAFIAAEINGMDGKTSVEPVKDSLLLGNDMEIAYGTTSVLAAVDGMFFNHGVVYSNQPLSASVYVGNNIHYNGGTANVMTVGSNIAVKGSNSLNVGADLVSFGDKIFQYGIGNTVNTFTSGGASACSVNIGRGNAQGYGGSMLIGYNNGSSAAWNIAIGEKNNMAGQNGRSFGDANKTWNGGVVVGKRNELCKDENYVFGADNTAWADNNFIFGRHNKAGYENSYMFGEGLADGNSYTFMIGRYNVSLTDSVLEIGWGTSNTDRNTIFRIDREGNVYCSGKVYADSLESNSTWPNKMKKPST